MTKVKMLTILTVNVSLENPERNFAVDMNSREELW